MLGEVLIGLCFLALGWMCLSYAFRQRRVGCSRPPAEDDGNEGAAKPLMIIPTVLGILFLVVGKGLLVVVLLEMF